MHYPKENIALLGFSILPKRSPLEKLYCRPFRLKLSSYYRRRECQKSFSHSLFIIDLGEIRLLVS